MGKYQQVNTWPLWNQFWKLQAASLMSDHPLITLVNSRHLHQSAEVGVNMSTPVQSTPWPPRSAQQSAYWPYSRRSFDQACRRTWQWAWCMRSKGIRSSLSTAGSVRPRCRFCSGRSDVACPTADRRTIWRQNNDDRWLTAFIFTRSDRSRLRARGFTFVWLCVCFPHDISKSDAARIPKLDTEMFHDKPWEPVYFADKRSEVKVTSHHSCECWLLLLFYFLFLFLPWY